MVLEVGEGLKVMVVGEDAFLVVLVFDMLTSRPKKTWKALENELLNIPARIPDVVVPVMKRGFDQS